MEDHLTNERLAGLNRFAAVPLDLEVGLARLSLSVRELLDLSPGRLLKTNRRIGGLLEVRVGGAAVAQAEIVNASGRAAVRLKTKKL